MLQGASASTYGLHFHTRASAQCSHGRRNDLCPCGSGTKYKRCCGGPTVN
ncbi:MAG: SEC-C metal-binding domain-containing protein [Acidobacteriota bacterium]|nr:SEC-C metal-binding domain-containing protein [Acidobacteriota bacterium]